MLNNMSSTCYGHDKELFKCAVVDTNGPWALARVDTDDSTDRSLFVVNELLRFNNFNNQPEPKPIRGEFLSHLGVSKNFDYLGTLPGGVQCRDDPSFGDCSKPNLCGSAFEKFCPKTCNVCTARDKHFQS